LSLRDQILAANDLKTATVEVSEWEVTIPVRELTAAERERVFDLHAKNAGVEAVCHTIVAGARDENGDKLFTEDDVLALSEKSDSALTQLYSKIMELSGVHMSEDGESEAGKPSETTPSSGANTGSCTNSESDATPS